ncbi:MAG: phosphoglycerate dehydrogenase [Martelella sp.]|uniref:phosphoglycerate dehydrogenase n=1 Tax=Martelella sp. TaxID=1969699 RepID=UPI0032426F76
MSGKSHRVVVTQNFFDPDTRRYLEKAGCEVVQAELPPGSADRNMDHDTLVSLLAGADGWIVGHAMVTRELMQALPDLKIISRRGVGYERVDCEAARDLGKVVCIAAGGNDASVADHTLAMMLAVGHRLRETQANMIDGNWKILSGRDLFRKTVGIVGLGRIGKSLVQRLQGFQARILVTTRTRDAAYAETSGVEYCDLDHLLRESDYVSLHAPLTDATRFLIDAKAMAMMKEDAILVNAARGGLVDDRALLETLRRGHLFGAALDTFVSEADATYQPVTAALLTLPNVVATPHAGASTKEGLIRTNRVAAECVVAVLCGGRLNPDCVVTDGRTPPPA